MSAGGLKRTRRLQFSASAVNPIADTDRPLVLVRFEAKTGLTHCNKFREVMRRVRRAMSISLRSVLKSIGLVSSASAPFALRAGSDRAYVARPRREPCPVHAPGTASWW